MPDLINTVLTIPPAPAYGVPVSSREIRVRIKDERGAFTEQVADGATQVDVRLPADKTACVELVNVLEAEGQREQDLLVFAVGQDSVSPGGLSAKVAAEPSVPAPSPLDPSPAVTDDTPADDDSAVAELNAPEAIEAIGRMRSTEKLEHIAASDKRITVQEAARKRLETLAE